MMRRKTVKFVSQYNTNYEECKTLSDVASIFVDIFAFERHWLQEKQLKQCVAGGKYLEVGNILKETQYMMRRTEEGEFEIQLICSLMF